MAQVVYTPELGAGSGSVSQTVPQNSTSLADSIGQAFGASVSHIFSPIKDAFKEQGDRMTDFGTFVDGNGLSGIAGSTSSSIDDYQKMVGNVANGTGATSAKGSGYDLSSLTGSSAYQNHKSLQAMYDMFQKTGDSAWLEKFIESYGNIENMESARAYEKMMSDTSFSRLINDIKKSGYNPWLALQNGSFGQASSYNSSAASVGSTSPTQQALSRANNENTVSANRLNTISTIIGTILRIGIMAALMA